MLVVCCILAASVPFARLEHNASFQSIALMPWIGLKSAGPLLPVLVAAFTLGCGLLWLRSQREGVGRLWFVTGLTMTLLAMLAIGGNASSASDTARTFQGGSATWIDDAVPAGTTVPVVWRERLASSGRLDPFAPWLMVAEFFNPAVGDVYRLGGPTYYEDFLPTKPITKRADGTLVVDGKPLEARFVLVTCQTPVVGTVVAHAPHGALELVKTRGAPAACASQSLRRGSAAVFLATYRRLFHHGPGMDRHRSQSPAYLMGIVVGPRPGVRPDWAGASTPFRLATPRRRSARNDRWSSDHGRHDVLQLHLGLVLHGS